MCRAGFGSRCSFNPRTRVGCDRRTAGHVARQRQVSIHAPAWGATSCPNSLIRAMKSFNPRTRVGCDRNANSRTQRHQSFNPRTRVGCDLSPNFQRWASWACFNPRTRVGCDEREIMDEMRTEGFNPRTRVGCDQGVREKLLRCKAVSIHAPAWGATRCTGCKIGVGEVSIHAPAWGATRPGFHPSGTIPRFQSTHPRGVRLVRSKVKSISLCCFNPRTRVGCDPVLLRLLQLLPVSIHAPAWGATRVTPGRQPFMPVSIHAPAWGATWTAPGISG